nr:PREDICTED: uncharacterized protein LOC109036529 [Bemisia tabaci]
MSLLKEPLQPLSWSKLEKLLEILRLDMPDALTVHGIVQTALRWRQTDASERIKVYTTGEKLGSAAIVCIYRVTDNLNYRVAMHCTNKNTSTLRNALLTTRRINWNSSETTIHFTAFHEKLLPILEECLPHHKFQMMEYPSAAGAPRLPRVVNNVYKWITSNQLASCNFTCPPEVNLAPVGLESVELIRSNWFNHPDAAEYIPALIKHNPSLGVYSRATGELCAWVLFSEFCALTMLHTVERHRRKGYSQLLINAICKRLLPEGLIVGAAVILENTASLRLFESLKFKSSQDYYSYVLAAPSAVDQLLNVSVTCLEKQQM